MTFERLFTRSEDLHVCSQCSAHESDHVFYCAECGSPLDHEDRPNEFPRRQVVLHVHNEEIRGAWLCCPVLN